MSYLDKLLQGTEVEWKTLGEVAEIGTGSSNRQDEDENGIYPFYVRSKNILSANSYEFDEIAVIVPGEGGIGDIFHYVEGKYALHQRAYRIHIIDNVIIGKFFYYVMTCHFKKYILSKSVGSTSVSIRKPMLEKFSIPIPPLSVQEEIVRILDKFTALEAELDCRKRQYEYYRDHLLTVNEQGLMNNQKVEWKTFGDTSIFEVSSGGTPSKSQKKFWEGGNIPWLKSESCNNESVHSAKNFITELGLKQSSAKLLSRNTTLMALVGATIFKTAFLEFEATTNQNIASIKSLNQDVVNDKFVFYYMTNLYETLKSEMRSYSMLNLTTLRQFKVPIPPIEEQERIVAILDKFDTLAHSISEGLPKEIELRKKQYEYYRDQLLSFNG
ncbi:restriction endonuclease subunit S [Riemerella anatipestifer]|uniref:Restriction endonuclease subunit S n=1 Tax=Riemerella anatipestifer TaxID=34085 RepID=A0AAP3AKC9_RIEAN|nr:restriction endonuclease subunit S [Riemerella anatipestifer]MBT0551418.1 restriction endonuclease subunit S [Riemerella anatipestifer]MBT0553795.1 restriction endonuclease subunit S [Riemerella anatipestifer]MBT0572276.1 restriction endonuclease subunit S [Riemerella anatipestifer]MCE3024177.1 restriction endonuclease subunit S [Riemerella anatipestifer]MCO7318476.1 restriction endonuclease subunit S [Riemerella anatipestifer]